MTHHVRTRQVRRMIAALIAAVVGLTMALSGCSSSGSAERETIKKGVLTVGVPTFPPFVGLSNGKITGPDGEIVYALAKRLNLKVEPVAYEFSALIPALQQNRIDIAVGSIFRTKERAKVVSFTYPLYIEPGSFIAKSQIDSVDQLKGTRVGTVEGYNWVADIQKILGSQKLVTYPSSTELNEDLKAGRLDVGIDSYSTAKYLHKGDSFVITQLPKDSRIKSAIHPGQTAILVNKNNTALLNSLDTQIKYLHEHTTVIPDALKANGLDQAQANVGTPGYL